MNTTFNQNRRKRMPQIMQACRSGQPCILADALEPFQNNSEMGWYACFCREHQIPNIPPCLVHHRLIFLLPLVVLANWVAIHATRLPPSPPLASDPLDVNELDELYTFIGAKKTGLCHHPSRSGHPLRGRVDGGIRSGAGNTPKRRECCSSRSPVLFGCLCTLRCAGLLSRTASILAQQESDLFSRSGQCRVASLSGSPRAAVALFFPLTARVDPGHQGICLCVESAATHETRSSALPVSCSRFRLPVTFATPNGVASCDGPFHPPFESRRFSRPTSYNLAWVCFLCNPFKGSDLSSIDPLTGKAAYLFNPRKQQWKRHFRLESGRIEPPTANGRATAYLLQFNTQPNITERLKLMAVGHYPHQ